MKQMPTPHIEAKEKDQIAKTVLITDKSIPAKFIAERFLDDPEEFNSDKEPIGYTGYYEGKKISVIGPVIGMQLIRDCAHELFNSYGVDNIIRVGTCRGYKEDLKIGDIIVVKDAWTMSTYGRIFYGYSKVFCAATKKLMSNLMASALYSNEKIINGNVHSEEEDNIIETNIRKSIEKYNHCIAVEMESYALFLNAEISNKSAATILTVSSLLKNNFNSTDSSKAEMSIQSMVKIALKAGINC
jgi:purine-nucleoside phosphorylase